MAEYRNHYQEIISRLQATRRKENALTLSTAIFYTLSVSAGILLLVALVESLAHGDRTFRGALAALWLAGTLGAAVYFLLPFVKRRKASDEYMALRVGKVFPDIQDMLSNALQLVPYIETPKGNSPMLALAAFEQVSVRSRDKNFDEVIDRREPKRAGIFFLSTLLAVALLFLVFSNSLGSGLYRVVNYNSSFLPPAPFSLSIEPKEKFLLRGEKAVIRVIAKGKIPDEIRLHIREEQQENYDTYALHSDSSVFEYEIPTLKKSVEFYADAPWLTEFVRTATGKILVSDRPVVRTMSGRVNPPSYTRAASIQLSEQAGDISALAGSRVELSVQANKDIVSGQIVILKQRNGGDSTKNNAVDTVRVPMKVSGRQASGGFSIGASGQYYISVKDARGEENADPVKYSISAQRDGSPSITMLEPGSEAQIGETAMLPMRIAISDDYGFSRLLLHYRMTESQYGQPEQNFKQIQIPVNPGQSPQDVLYTWDLNKIGITPSDKYEFFAEIFDNDAVGGPKSARTGIISVKYPSLDEVLDQADKEHDKIEKDLQAIAKQAEEVRKNMDELNRELMKQQNKQQADWKEQKQAQDLMKKQSELQDKMQKAQESLQDLTQKLQEHKTLSPETLQKYMELQKLMKEMNNPELRRQMEQIQQMMEKMTPEQLQQAMKNFQFNEEEFKKNIERTMKLLERMQAEQKADAIQKKAQDLEKKQNELQKQAENANPNDKEKRDELANQQEQLQKETGELQKDLNDLQKQMEKLGENMPMDEMKKAQQELNSQETQNQMQQAQQNMQKGDMQKAQQNQKNAQQNLQKFSQQMQSMKQQMRQNQTKEAVKEMQRAMNDMMELSKQQENLRQQTQQMDQNSNKFNQAAQEQQRIQQNLREVANRMQQLGQKNTSVTPEMGKEMGNAIREMQKSTQQLAQRQGQQSAQSQGEAMSSMNKTVMQMQDQISQMQGQGQGQGEGDGGQGFSQKLQQAAGQQQSINGQMQQMQQGQGQGLSPQQQAEMGRLAAQQGKVQKTVEELAREQKKDPGQKKALGNLENLAKEMQEVLRDMQSGNITPQTRQRQEKILSRLLDASRSMNERDFEKQRESNSGRDVVRQSPGQINPGEQGKTNGQDQMRQPQQGYTKDYEELIRQYMEALQKKQPARP